MTSKENIVERNVEEEMKESYLRYSLSVIIARALPDVRDGLKPSQRRILFAMRQLGLSPGGKHRKCAKISGDTSGDYHPHGEQVIYPTLVRMAQEWAMRYCLVNGQGNFGSIDGDPPAAMRYTEARLTSASVQLMEDLDKDTVDMLPNYDETKLEPMVFPAKFPNLLCNGSSGIAVGMATNIPPHNLRELAQATLLILEDRNAPVEELMKVMPGPDFPTGGIICGYRGIKEAYHTGRGKILLRGLTHVEEGESPDRQRLIIDEIPFNVNKARLIERVAELIGNKEITGIADVRDESDKRGMRIVFELKRNEMVDVILNQLYKLTDLQTTFGCNMLALDKGLPRTMNLKQMILAWVQHRIEVVRRRTRFELNKAEARAHILEGYLKAVAHLDEIVQIIRKSIHRDAAKLELSRRFELTEKQANAVLDLRLYQLTGLEREKISTEYDDLTKKIAHYRAVLAQESLVREIIREELLEVQKQHKEERRTRIIAAEGEFHVEDLIANESVVITLSADDYIKRMPTQTFREQRRGGQGVAGFDLKRETDEVKELLVAKAHDHLLLFTNFGRCYWLKAWQVPETGRRSKGKPLINLVEGLQPEEKVATLLSVSQFTAETAVFMVTRQGVVKKTDLEAFAHPRRTGVYALVIDEGDELMTVRLVREEQQVMLFTRKGMAVRFDASAVRSVGRVTRGVKGVTLRPGDYVVSCEVVYGHETILVVCEKGYGKRSRVEEFRKTNRGSIGVRSIITSERNGPVIGAISVTDDDGLLMMSTTGQAIRIGVRDLRIIARATQGVRLANLREKDALVVIQKLEGLTEEELAKTDQVPQQPLEEKEEEEENGGSS